METLDKLTPMKQRQAILDTFCASGKYHQDYLSCLVNYQTWAKEEVHPTSIDLWYTEPALWDYLNHLHEGLEAATKAKRTVAALTFFLHRAGWTGPITGRGGLMSPRVLAAQ